jgi:hypothetical protein
MKCLMTSCLLEMKVRRKGTSASASGVGVPRRLQDAQKRSNSLYMRGRVSLAALPARHQSRQ